MLINVFSKSNVIGKINYLFDTYTIDKNIFSYGKAVLELGDRDKFSTLKIDKSKPYLEYNPIMDEIKYSDIYGHSNFVYHVFPKGLEKKDDPYLSKSLFLNIDSHDANKLQMVYNKRLNEGLVEKKRIISGLLVLFWMSMGHLISCHYMQDLEIILVSSLKSII